MPSLEMWSFLGWAFWIISFDGVGYNEKKKAQKQTKQNN